MNSSGVVEPYSALRKHNAVLYCCISFLLFNLFFIFIVVALGVSTSKIDHLVTRNPERLLTSLRSSFWTIGLVHGLQDENDYSSGTFK